MANFYPSRRRVSISKTISDTQLYTCELDIRKISDEQFVKLVKLASVHSESVGYWVAVKQAARELKLARIKPNQGFCPSCYRMNPVTLKVDADKFLCCPECLIP